MEDIVVPSGNEKELAQMAERLGISSLVFLYPFGKVPKTAPVISIPVRIGVIAHPDQVPMARKQAQFVVVESSELDRLVVERREVPDMIVGLERVAVKEKLHQRASNLDHVSGKLYKQKGVSIGVSLRELVRLSPRERAVALGRIQQNVRFARKFGVGVVFASFARLPSELRSPHDIASLVRVLGG